MLNHKSLFSYFILFFLVGCNYYYHQGLKLEKEQWNEEANIAYQRAMNEDPDDKKFQKAFLRTAKATVKDLMERYFLYLQEKKLPEAYVLLKKAISLTPLEETVVTERKKWTKVLLIGKLDFQFQDLQAFLALKQQMYLTLRWNRPYPGDFLKATVDLDKGIFFVEDVLYKAEEKLYFFYTLHSIGISSQEKEFLNNRSSHEEFFPFISLGTPLLKQINGELTLQTENKITSVKSFFSKSWEQKKEALNSWPLAPIEYEVFLQGNSIEVTSNINANIFLPQALYINQTNQRVLLDFGHLILQQDGTKNYWRLERKFQKKPAYITTLQKNMILLPYMFFREGAFSLEPKKEKGFQENVEKDPQT